MLQFQTRIRIRLYPSRVIATKPGEKYDRGFKAHAVDAKPALRYVSLHVYDTCVAVCLYPVRIKPCVTHMPLSLKVAGWTPDDSDFSLYQAEWLIVMDAKSILYAS